MSERVRGCFFERYKAEDDEVQIGSHELRRRIAELERENYDLRKKLEQLKDYDRKVR